VKRFLLSSWVSGSQQTQIWMFAVIVWVKGLIRHNGMVVIRNKIAMGVWIEKQLIMRLQPQASIVSYTHQLSVNYRWTKKTETQSKWLTFQLSCFSQAVTYTVTQWARQPLEVWLITDSLEKRLWEIPHHAMKYTAMFSSFPQSVLNQHLFN